MAYRVLQTAFHIYSVTCDLPFCEQALPLAYENVWTCSLVDTIYLYYQLHIVLCQHWRHSPRSIGVEFYPNKWAWVIGFRSCLSVAVVLNLCTEVDICVQSFAYRSCHVIGDQLQWIIVHGFSFRLPVVFIWATLDVFNLEICPLKGCSQLCTLLPVPVSWIMELLCGSFTEFAIF